MSTRYSTTCFCFDCGRYRKWLDGDKEPITHYVKTGIHWGIVHLESQFASGARDWASTDQRIQALRLAPEMQEARAKASKAATIAKGIQKIESQVASGDMDRAHADKLIKELRAYFS